MKPWIPELGRSVQAQSGIQFFIGEVVAVEKTATFENASDTPVCIKGKFEGEKEVYCRWFLTEEHNIQYDPYIKKSNEKETHSTRKETCGNRSQGEGSDSQASQMG